MSSPELNDAQKEDLSRIWSTLCIDLWASNSSSVKTNNDENGQTTMDDNSYQFIVRLTFFFIWAISNPESASSSQHVRDDPTSPIIKPNSTIESLQCVFSIPISSPSTGNSQSSPALIIPRPNIPQGRCVIFFDHTSFLSELESYEQKKGYSNSNSSFGAFLYHRPQFGLVSMSCAISLTMVTMFRRSIISRSDVNAALSPLNRGSTSAMPSELFTIVTKFQNVYPTIQIQDVKTSNSYKLLTLTGRIIKIHPKRLRLVAADVLCVKCGEQFPQRFQDGRYEIPNRCQQQGCRSKVFDLIRRTASFIDYQQLKLQEETDHSSSSAGRTPRQIDIEVTHDLVDTCHAGDVVRIVGIIHAVNTAMASGKVGKKARETSTYHLYMVANSISNTTAELQYGNERGKKRKIQRGGENGSKSTTSSRHRTFTEEQLSKITKLAHADHMWGPLSVRMAFPFDLLVRSLCPSIIGHDMVKAGILLGLLGGTPLSSTGVADMRSGVMIRSNIHCLIVGDPGMGKSQMLLAATQIAERSVYVGGNTSTTTGLTVSLTKEAGGEVGIEAGALVLADQGVCCIDEFDKMATSNQDGLLEAMEQQQISIAKAGVLASVPARCCVIAAANPRQGKYNMNKSVVENLKIAAPLLSRFDLVFILKDEADDEQDKLVSSNIMNLYRQGGNKSNSTDVHTSHSELNNVASTDHATMKHRLPWVALTQMPLPAEMLKDYISYAREYCKPKLTQVCLCRPRYCLSFIILTHTLIVSFSFDTLIYFTPTPRRPLQS